MQIIETKEDMSKYEKHIWKKFWLKKGLKTVFKEVKYKITEENKQIGYVSVMLDAGVLYVKEIIIEEEYRGSKKGHNIMDFLDNLAKENNCHKIRLETSPEFMPNAYHLYQKYGFREETRLKNDWFNKDWKIMSKFIDYNKQSKSED